MNMIELTESEYNAIMENREDIKSQIANRRAKELNSNKAGHAYTLRRKPGNLKDGKGGLSNGSNIHDASRGDSRGSYAASRYERFKNVENNISNNYKNDDDFLKSFRRDNKDTFRNLEKEKAEKEILRHDLNRIAGTNRIRSKENSNDRKREKKAALKAKLADK